MTSLCTTSAINVFISRIPSSSFWNIALALSSSSPRASAPLRLRSAAFNAAARFAEDEAEREEDEDEDTEDAEDAEDASSTVAPFASSSASASVRLVPRAPETVFSSRLLVASSASPRFVVSPSVSLSFSAYTSRADARTRVSVSSTASREKVASACGSPRALGDAPEPVSVGADVAASSSASSLASTRNALL